MSHEHWAAQVEDMVSRGAKGSPADIELVIQYLSAFFGNDAAVTTKASSANADRQSRGSPSAKSPASIPFDELVPSGQHGEPDEKKGQFRFPRGSHPSNRRYSHPDS